MKCQVCGKEYRPDCDYRQGRCPHHPPMLNTLKIVKYIKDLLKK